MRMIMVMIGFIYIDNITEYQNKQNKNKPLDDNGYKFPYT